MKCDHVSLCQWASLILQISCDILIVIVITILMSHFIVRLYDTIRTYTKFTTFLLIYRNKLFIKLVIKLSWLKIGMMGAWLDEANYLRHGGQVVVDGRDCSWTTIALGETANRAWLVVFSRWGLHRPCYELVLSTTYDASCCQPRHPRTPSGRHYVSLVLRHWPNDWSAISNDSFRSWLVLFSFINVCVER